MWAMGQGSWFTEEEQCNAEVFEDCHGSYHESMLTESVQRASRITLKAMLVLTCVLVICCYKWRFLSNIIIYIEFAMRITTLFFANSASS